MKAKMTLEQLKYDIDTGLTVNQIAQKYNTCQSAIYYRCKRNGLPNPVVGVHHRTRNHTFNTRFFEHMDTEAKAYVLGFIAADGGRDRNWGIKIALHPRDTDILVSIAAAMECDYEPTLVEHGTRIKLGLYDIDLVQDLEHYGIVERKTKTLPFAKSVPPKLLRHYMRGMFDGDGSVGKQARLVTGSRPFYIGFTTWYANRFNNDLWHRQEGKKYRLVFNQRDKRFMKWMYDDCNIVLQRKHESFRRIWAKL